MKNAAMTNIEKKSSTERRSITDAIEMARMRPSLLNEYEASLLSGVEALVRKGRAPSERQTRAVLAIANRVASGEARKPAMPTTAPAAKSPASTPTAKTGKITGQTPAAARKYGTAIRQTAHIPKAEPFAVGATVVHDRYGKGVVMLSDDEKTVAKFIGSKPGYGDNPAIRVLTVALIAS